MARAAHLVGIVAIALLAALLMAALPQQALAQATRTIRNVATLDWSVNGSAIRIESNRVDIVVQANDEVTSSPYRLAGYEIPPTLLESSCLVPQGPGAIPGDASPPLSSYGIISITDLMAGQPLVLALDRPSANLDASAVEAMQVHVTTGDGDEELLTFRETDANSGRFLAIVSTASGSLPILGDCKLTVMPGTRLTITFRDSSDGPAISELGIDILIDPLGVAFDSRDGTPISGVRVTLIDVATGQPAQVLGDDWVSTYPSTVITGQSVTDSGGTVYSFPQGDYRFPFVRPGTYRLQVEPVSPYAAPSAATSEQLASLRRPDGQPFTIGAGSYGGLITLTDPSPVRIDIPLDRPVTPIILTKTAARSDAEAGDLVQYRIVIRNPDSDPTGALTVTDRIPDQMRYRPGSAKIDGAAAADPHTNGQRQLTFTLPSIAPSSSVVLTYVLEVRPGASAGDALNRAQASGPFNNRSNIADALVRIRQETISDRMTIIGQVLDGGCDDLPDRRRGIAGVRVMMQDGSYSVTDPEGRYHFEGVRRGTHVVQLDEMTLPADRAAIDCARNVRSGGSAISRFVDGQGGALKRVDFHATDSATRAKFAAAKPDRPAAPSDGEAAGTERDWLAGQEPGISWLFPVAAHNPRAPVIRVAIKHPPGQSVRLRVDGRPVDAIAFEGTRKNPAGTIAVSLWRGVPIEGRKTRLQADIVDRDGAIVAQLQREVTFSSTAVRAELISDRSRLLADGITRPLIALRILDRDGRPVHHGMTGEFALPAPYSAAIEADAQQARQLAGLERANPIWRVVGDEGIALIELEPTTASGTLVLHFAFRDEKRVRRQRIEAWLDPGNRPWTLVGIAEGTVGFNRLDRNLESLGKSENELITDGRLALYAKGRVLGRWLMTLAYDSDRKTEETRFGGTIDPTAYYTVYADRSEQRYDATSVRKLYLKLERPQFYALFGDFDTGIDEPKLNRYVRSLNGGKTEFRSEQVSAVLFASDTPTRHRRDEIQGNGLTGPYQLGARDILANSERIVIETRDRLRSDQIVESRLLTRHIDYDIDYAAGTVRFREPILSRSSSLDPQFIVADYEVDGIADRKLNAGGRVAFRTRDQSIQLGATAIRDSGNIGKTDTVGVDVRLRPSAATEIRAEAAISRSNDADRRTSTAWLVEAEHHTAPLDIVAYASDRESGFGAGQLNAAEAGVFKIGFDGRVQIREPLQFTASAWREDYHGSDARRLAGRALLEYRGRTTSARAGLVYADDQLADGRDATSTLLQLGATHRLLGNRLEIEAQSELPIAGEAESIDFPTRHRFSGRFSINRDVALVATYEIAEGEHIDARTARIGFDLAPWAGARFALSGNVQDIAEYGPRSFASFGLSQSLAVSKQLTVDFSLDGNRTFGGVDPSRVLNPLHPIASGGHLGSGSLVEDFLAVTAGATWRSNRWTVTGRGEWRDGDRDRRYGLTLGALRQIGEGRAVGGALNWFTARVENGAETRTVNGQLSWAHRPSDNAWSWLDKLELRADSVKGAVAGQPGPLGPALEVTGDARSVRVINSLSVNYSPSPGRGNWIERTEIALFWGTRYVADRYDGDDIKGWSNLFGADLRFDLGRRLEIGAAGSVRAGLDVDSIAFSAGPQVSIAPFDNGWLQVGWNLAGFRDRDFAEDRYTRDGPYVTMRVKFDQTSFAGLGLGLR